MSNVRNDNLHKFPSFCKAHNSKANYVSFLFYEASLDDLVHNNNYQCHLLINKINLTT